MNACKFIDIQTRADHRGALGVLEGNISIPFEIKRVFWIYDVPANASRGAHSSKYGQILIPITGGVTVVVNDGQNEKAYRLESATQGLYIPGMIWRDLKEFKENSSCLVLCEDYFQESHYIRNFQQYLTAIKENPLNSIDKLSLDIAATP